MNNLGNKVSLVHVEDSQQGIQRSISEALDLINPKISNEVKSIAIKPNLAYYWDATTGYTTDPRIVAGIIDWVRDRYGEDVAIKVVESDATAMRTKLAFPMLGYKKLEKEKGIELFNLSNDSTVVKTTSVNGNKLEFNVPKLLLDSDLFINVPKLKIMRETRFTCAMKNIFGCIAYPRKIIYHPVLNEAIVGINKILHPHLTIVDGLFALGRYPIKLGLLMASEDPFSIDWIASEITGTKQSGVKFLQIAIEENLGSPKGINTFGQDLKEFQKIFPHERRGISTKRLWAAQLGLLKAYFKVVNDVMPPVLQE